jgi:hypothetical protein
MVLRHPYLGLVVASDNRWGMEMMLYRHIIYIYYIYILQPIKNLWEKERLRGSGDHRRGIHYHNNRMWLWLTMESPPK